MTKHGETSTCRHCGEPIRYLFDWFGGRWNHLPGPRESSDQDLWGKLHEAKPLTRKGKR